tara:strand:- start:946 stop:1092 length:147 start_codon:yes stop_codon:yes gene_type:complete
MASSMATIPSCSPDSDISLTFEAEICRFTGCLFLKEDCLGLGEAILNL